ncbi:MAG TPA: ferrochelatase [Bacteroidales bacterium]|nr:ferrochelatase [Bacteroidales bacterium]
MKKALLLVNVGTPEKPEPKAVRKFLTAFLNDKRVIDIPWLFRKILVNLIIIPFRVMKSTALYKKLWTPEGSPLLLHLLSLKDKLSQLLAGKYDVYACMRYGEPSLKEGLAQLKKRNTDEIIVLPLFPQYASSTTGSVTEKVFEIVKKWEAIPDIRVIDRFYSHPAFISAFSSQIGKYNPQWFDHIIFSYHGLPLSQIRKIHPENNCNGCSCEQSMPECGTWCYKANCYETTRLLVKTLNIPDHKFSVAFQSRLTRNWLSPFTDELIKEQASKGNANILVVAPSFVADCLETIVEIEMDYKQLFIEHGGRNLTLVKSLNDSDEWASAIVDIITTQV